MANKSIYTLFFIIFSSILFANEIRIEGKAAYFRPTASVTRDIYGSFGLYSLEALYSPWCDLYFWGSVGFATSSGKSTVDKSKTTLTYVPISAGLKYLFQINSFRPYFGAGPLAAYLHTKDDSPFVVKKREKWGVGAIVKAGLIYDISRHFFLDAFVEYSFMGIDFSRMSITLGQAADISGLAAGGAIGIRF